MAETATSYIPAEDFEAHADIRSITLYEELSARGPLWPVPEGAIKQGVELLQDAEGRLYLTRSSPDGFVQGYRILGKDGNQLQVAPQFRPGTSRTVPRPPEPAPAQPQTEP